MCAHHLYYMPFKILPHVVNDTLFNMTINLGEEKLNSRPVGYSTSKFTHFLLIETSEEKRSIFRI